MDIYIYPKSLFVDPVPHICMPVCEHYIFAGVIIGKLEQSAILQKWEYSTLTCSCTLPFLVTTPGK